MSLDSKGFTDLRRADRIKALVYEGDGFVLAYKRLSNGRYQWPRNVEELKVVSGKIVIDIYVPVAKLK